MKTWKTATSIFAVAGMLSAGSIYLSTTTPEARADSSMESKDKQEKPDLVTLAASNEDLSTLVDALVAADLTDTLRGDGPFTVFAPSNDAFDDLPDGALDALMKDVNKDKLKSVLLYHVVEDKLPSNKIQTRTIETAQGDPINITVRDGDVMVNDAKVVKTDIYGSNGVVHIIDKVLMPGQ